MSLSQSISKESLISLTTLPHHVDEVMGMIVHLIITIGMNKKVSDLEGPILTNLPPQGEAGINKTQQLQGTAIMINNPQLVRRKG